MDFLIKSKEYQEEKKIKIDKITNIKCKKETELDDVKLQMEAVAANLNVNFDEAKMANLRELRYQIEELEEDIKMLNQNIESIENECMEYSIDKLISEILEKLEDAEIKKHIQNIKKAKEKYIKAVEAFENFSEGLASEIVDVKNCILDNLNYKELEMDKIIHITRNNCGYITDLRLNSLNVDYLPKDLELTYEEATYIKYALPRIDKIRRSI